mmetsp:Transcript_3312/g.6228  ORF Transcript_3312/g.6228 Transcript_3312/m.6228 type:complete len:164 (+) Transcript_3312:31-522(+)
MNFTQAKKYCHVFGKFNSKNDLPNDIILHEFRASFPRYSGSVPSLCNNKTWCHIPDDTVPAISKHNDIAGHPADSTLHVAHMGRHADSDLHNKQHLDLHSTRDAQRPRHDRSAADGDRDDTPHALSQRQLLPVEDTQGRGCRAQPAPEALQQRAWRNTPPSPY